MNFIEQLDESLKLLKEMREDSALHERIENSIKIMLEIINSEKPLLVCGNGGSSSDAEHITGELVGRFLKERKAINAISLSSNSAAVTAWSNDYDYESVFARQVEAHGKNGGVLFCISTSGNSKNVIKAIEMAKSLNIKVIGLTGKGGGKMKELCDILLDVPSTHTPRIQELHIKVYHYICEELERLYQG